MFNFFQTIIHKVVSVGTAVIISLGIISAPTPSALQSQQILSKQTDQIVNKLSTTTPSSTVQNTKSSVPAIKNIKPQIEAAPISQPTIAEFVPIAEKYRKSPNTPKNLSQNHIPIVMMEELLNSAQIGLESMDSNNKRLKLCLNFPSIKSFCDISTVLISEGNNVDGAIIGDVLGRKYIPPFNVFIKSCNPQYTIMSAFVNKNDDYQKHIVTFNPGVSYSCQLGFKTEFEEQDKVIWFTPSN